MLRYNAAPAGQGSPVCLCGITQRGGPVDCWAPSCFRRFWAQVTTLALTENCSPCQELGKNRSLIWSGNFSEWRKYGAGLWISSGQEEMWLFPRAGSGHTRVSHLSAHQARCSERLKAGGTGQTPSLLLCWAGCLCPHPLDPQLSPPPTLCCQE